MVKLFPLLFYTSMIQLWNTGHLCSTTSTTDCTWKFMDPINCHLFSVFVQHATEGPNRQFSYKWKLFKMGISFPFPCLVVLQWIHHTYPPCPKFECEFKSKLMIQHFSLFLQYDHIICSSLIAVVVLSPHNYHCSCCHFCENQRSSFALCWVCSELHCVDLLLSSAKLWKRLITQNQIARVLALCMLAWLPGDWCIV
jgi:hypothetical protein